MSSHIRLDGYAIGREDTTNQVHFVGDQKLENNKSKMADGCYLRNACTQARLSQPDFDR